MERKTNGKDAIVEYSYQRALRRLGEAMESGGDPQANDLQLVVLLDVRSELRDMRQSVEGRFTPRRGRNSPADGAAPLLPQRIRSLAPPVSVGVGIGASIVYVALELIRLFAQ